MLAAALLCCASFLNLITAIPESADANKLTISLNGCIQGKQASIVLPSMDSQTMQTTLSNINKQFPVTIFASDDLFTNAQSLHMLQAAQATKLHTIGYQFSGEITKNPKFTNAGQIEAAIKNAKQYFKTYLNQSLVYVLIPSAAPKEFVDTVARNAVYPVVPNVDSQEFKTPTGSNILSSPKGIVMAVTPELAPQVHDNANALSEFDYEIVPLTHCLPVQYNDPKMFMDMGNVEDDEDFDGEHDGMGEDMTPGMEHSVAGEPENKPVETTVATEESGNIPWGMIAIGAFVIGGVVLAIYFYRTQAN